MKGGDVEQFDVIVIGSGVSGQTAAAACAAGGKRVAVIDREPFGGTCGRCGCEPKKVLLAAAEAITRTAPLLGDGIEGAAAISWPQLIARKRTFTEPVPLRITKWLSESGVTLVSGQARIVGDLEVAVGERRLSTADLVIATGARPRTLDIAGEELLTTSAGFMELEALPQRIVFVGGGYVSFELADIAHRAGSDVTIIHRSPHVLAGFDPHLAQKLLDRYRALGIRVLTDSALLAVNQERTGLTLQTSADEILCDLAVHGAGRISNADTLGLDTLGVHADHRGVQVDASLRSAGHSHVWAIGDSAALGLPLTPVAIRQGEIVAANILGGSELFDGAITTSAVFSDPPLATVGMSVADALAAPDRFEVLDHDMDTWFTQHRVGQTHAGARLVVERDTGKITGAHLLGVNAEEAINVFALAIKVGATRATLGEVLWAYPTAVSDVRYLV